MKIIINCCKGGYCLSLKAIEHMADAGDNNAKREFEEMDKFSLLYSEHHNRFNKYLVKAVEDLGIDANGPNSKLGILNVKSDKYYIFEYDGEEYLMTPESIKWIKI